MHIKFCRCVLGVVHELPAFRNEECHDLQS